VCVAKVEQEIGGHAVCGGGLVQRGGFGKLPGCVKAIGIFKLRFTGVTRAGEELGGGEQAKRLAKPVGRS
jgi:hypothetical protein